ncbi:hypothetical protein K438DRAFT_1762368 [Mycena galopus ATCC 62051]|nr:hypothetical protein K438DRAFT_1762368 [Mycena galopus ATCC 62051]
MPSSRRTITELRLDSITTCLRPIVTTLDEISQAFAIPFIKTISTTMLALINTAQKAKKNKEECARLLEDIPMLLYGLIDVLLKSESDLPPATLHGIGKFTQTLLKVLAFVEEQQEKNLFKHFFRQSEMTSLLNQCHLGIREALELFKVFSHFFIDTIFGVPNNLKLLEENVHQQHQRLLELIAVESDAASSERFSLDMRDSWRGTSYKDDNNRLKVLVPVREYMDQNFPARPALIQPLRQYLYEVLDIHKEYGNRLPSVNGQILRNMGNLRRILQAGLDWDGPHFEDTIYGVLSFQSFRRTLGHSRTSLMDLLPAAIHHTQNRELALRLILELLRESSDKAIDFEKLVEQAQDHFLEVLHFDWRLESLRKSRTSRMRLFGIAQSRVRKSDLRLVRSQISGKGSQVGRQALLQMRRTGREKCGKSEWSWSDGWKTCSPKRRINQILIWVNAIGCHRALRPSKNVVILRNAQKPNAACAAFAQALYYHFDHNRDIPTALDCYQTALSAATTGKDSHQQCGTLVQMAWVNHQIGQNAVARAHLEEAKRIARLSGNLLQEARALSYDSVLLRSAGRYNGSLSLCHAARQLLSLWGLSGGHLDNTVLGSLAEVHLQKSEYLEAKKIHSANAEGQSTVQNPSGYAYSLLNLAQLDILVGAAEPAVQENFEAAKKQFATVKSSVGLLYCDTFFAELHLREGRLGLAKKLFTRCLNLSWGKHNELVLLCLESAGNIRRWDRDYYGWTSPMAVVYFAFALKRKERRATYQAIRYLADICFETCDFSAAQSLYTLALEGFSLMDIHRGKADCMARLGDIAEQNGQLRQAVAFGQTRGHYSNDLRR